MSKSWPKVKLVEVLTPVAREEAVEAIKEYRLLGIRLDGQGPFLRETVTGTQTSATKLFRVAEGDFIYSRLFAWRGAFGVIEEQFDGCYVSGEFPTFLPKDAAIDVQFLRYWFRLRSTLGKVEEDCTGSTPLTRNRFNERFFLELQVPLPQFEEQRRIVARIEEFATKIEDARGLRKEAAEEAEALWAGGAKHIFERAEEQFPLCSLADVVSIAGGGTPSKANPFYWLGSIPWISPKDMKVRELRDSVDHISEQATVESPAKLIKPGAVLVVVRGMILVHTFPSALLRVPATINQDMKALTPKADLLPEYLCAFFWAFNDRVLALVEKSTHDTRKLETNVLMSMKLPVPPLPEQRRIVAQFDDLQREADGLKALQSETSAELGALMPSILDKAFRGEL